MLPEMSPATADALRAAFLRADYRTDGVRALLGREAHAALGRGEPEPAFRATADGAALGVLVRLLLLGAIEPDAAVAAALAPLDPADAAAAGLLRRAGDGWAAALDLRPHGADEGGEWWVLSDLDARRQERDHVTGVGGASLTLASATPRTPVGTVLDLGTGCGVQALHASRHAARRHRHGRRAAGAGDGPGDVRAQRAGRGAARRAVAGPGGRAPVRPDRVQPAVRPRPGPRRLRLPRLRSGRRRRARRAGRGAAGAPGARRGGAAARVVAARARRGLARPGPLLAARRASTRGSCSGR